MHKDKGTILVKKGKEKKGEKEKKKEEIVAKALDGQRYPCPA